MPQGVGRCRKCGLQKTLVKAHAIPRSFFKKLRGADKHSIQVDFDAKRLMSFWQAGVYDDAILCHECEASFSDLDRYGFEILGCLRLDKPILDERRRERAYRIEPCDTQRLKRFVLGVLWRASVSSAPFYEYCELGSAYESAFLQRIFSSDPLPAEDFTTTICRFDQTRLGDYKGVLFPPMRSRSIKERVNTQVLYLPDIRISVKVDQRPFRALEPNVALGKPGFFVMPKYPFPKGPFEELGFIDHMLRKLRTRPEALRS
jgi:hypothetical protein